MSNILNFNQILQTIGELVSNWFKLNIKIHKITSLRIDGVVMHLCPKTKENHCHRNTKSMQVDYMWLMNDEQWKNGCKAIKNKMPKPSMVHKFIDLV